MLRTFILLIGLNYLILYKAEACEIVHCENCSSTDPKICVSCQPEYILKYNKCFHKKIKSQTNKPPVMLITAYNAMIIQVKFYFILNLEYLCMICKKGFYQRDYKCFKDLAAPLNQEKHLCQVSNCFYCDAYNPHKCIKCQKSFYLFKNKCFLELNGQRPECYVSHCLYCKKKSDIMCRKCASGYYITNGDCSGNLANFGEFTSYHECYIENCDNCIEDKPNRCKVCKTGYFEQDFKCFEKSSHTKKENLILIEKIAVSYVIYICIGVTVSSLLLVAMILFYIHYKKKKQMEKQEKNRRSEGKYYKYDKKGIIYLK